MMINDASAASPVGLTRVSLSSLHSRSRPICWTCGDELAVVCALCQWWADHSTMQVEVVVGFGGLRRLWAKAAT